ncbi:MAG: F0F1 ATP synthase subunit epsilon [Propionibacteriaceae bacterium]|jgi:F-type H+-transporting ATPase subunit epsilon|nr:F0F1 ATP synthase subunit epsilon [Propionibacteriaceae bacterium]
MAVSFAIEVVAADRLVWVGQAVQLIATTTEGEIGVLARHEPLIATLASGVAEIRTAEGERLIVAVDGGFLSVSPERTSIISPYAQLVSEFDPAQAEAALRAAQAKIDAGDVSQQTLTDYHHAIAQVKAAARKG